MKIQHYMGEKNLFLSLSGVGTGKLLSPKSLGLNTDFLLGEKGGFPSSAQTVWQTQIPTQSLVDHNNKKLPFILHLTFKMPFAECTH